MLWHVITKQAGEVIEYWTGPDDSPDPWTQVRARAYTFPDAVIAWDVAIALGPDMSVWGYHA